MQQLEISGAVRPLKWLLGVKWLINLLKTKRNLFHIRNLSVPRSKHSLSQLYKTNLLMLYKAKVAACSEIRTKHSTQNEYHVVFFNVKPGGT